MSKRRENPLEATMSFDPNYGKSASEAEPTGEKTGPRQVFDELTDIDKSFAKSALSQAGLGVDMLDHMTADGEGGWSVDEVAEIENILRRLGEASTPDEKKAIGKELKGI